MRIRGLLLGAAGVVAGLSGAHAADFPVKAKPVEHMRICSLYGAGFYYIPGTDTCIRIGGHIRAEISFLGRGNGDASLVTGDGTSTRTRDQDMFFTRTRIYANVDTRTQTSFGTLRTFSIMRFEQPTPIGQAASASVPTIDTGIIQWGGFTIGRAAASYFGQPWLYAAKWGANGAYGSADSTSGRFVAAYTHQFGNGVSGTISLEDSKEQRRAIFNGANALSMLGLPGIGVDARGGNIWPEIVGQVRIEQAWGGFHISGNLINNRVAYNCGGVSVGACSELSGNVGDKVGGGVNAALKLNVPTMGVNDAIYVAGGWSMAATFDVIRGIGSGLGIYGGSNNVLAYGSFTGGYIFESVYNSTTGVGQQLTRTYGGNVAYEHGWNAEWRTSVFGGVEFVDYGAAANAILCGKMGVPSAAGGGGAAPSATTGVLITTGCNMDLRIAGAGSRTYWSPVRDLTIGAEFQWANAHSEHAAGTRYLQPAVNNFKPSAVYGLRDQNVYSGMFSVRRFF